MQRHCFQLKLKNSLILSLAAAGLIVCLVDLASGQHQAVAAASDKRSQAIELYNGKDYRGAAQLLDEYLLTNNNDPYAAYYAALVNQQLGNSNKARIYYKQVFTLAPTSQIGGYAKAILLKLDPSFAASQARVPDISATSGHAGVDSAKPGSPQGVASAIVNLPGQEEAPSLDPRFPAECRIPFIKSTQGVNLDCYINGRPIKMTFDTGAPNVMVGKNHLTELGIALPTGKPNGYTGGSASAAKVAFWIISATVKVGPIEKQNMPIMVLEFDHSSPLLGQTFFKNFDCTIDDGAGQINFRQKAISAKQSLSGGTISVPFTYREKGNRVIVDVEVNGKPMPMIFDTGNTANACSFMSPAQAARAGVQVPVDAATGTHIGVNGSGACKEFPLRRLRLGPIDRSDIIVSVNTEIADDDKGGLEAPLLGQPFWQGYEYTIDMKKKMIHFVRR